MISLLANELLITLNQALKSIDKLFIDAKILPNIYPVASMAATATSKMIRSPNLASIIACQVPAYMVSPI